ncbi:MAG: hypothetical protein EON54_14220 [Alcaligenaceae bacterium]|nr:MAG: hypothetical protein EON54_14220 [Alcaligenaceae bacterium]
MVAVGLQLADVDVRGRIGFNRQIGQGITFNAKILERHHESQIGCIVVIVNIVVVRRIQSLEALLRSGAVTVPMVSYTDIAERLRIFGWRSSFTPRAQYVESFSAVRAGVQKMRAQHRQVRHAQPQLKITDGRLVFCVQRFISTVAS